MLGGSDMVDVATVFLGMGSNIGDREQAICKAIQALKNCRIKVIKVSTIIETDPVDGPAQGKYLNAVVKCHTDLSPEGLLDVTQSIEDKMGRVRRIVNGPRVIDIDILLYDDVKLITRHLIIPHPRMLGREFVMRPLKEVDGKVYSELRLC